VVIRHATDQQLLELALIENVQRADLNPIEEAEAYHNLAKEFRMSHETIAARVGKSRVAVTNTMRLLDASVAVKQALVDGRISEGHARALLALTSAKAQEALLNQVIGTEIFRTKACHEKESWGERGCDRSRAPFAIQSRHESFLEAWQKGRHGHYLLLF
jgi:ParB family chromosome partitioning protein